jgi:hypothetical protein
MRMRLSWIALFTACLALQGCAADEYAAELSALLKTYSQQISRRLAEEEKRYRREAKILQDSDDALQNIGVDEQLASAAKALALQIRDGSATGSRAVSAASEFGQAEFERARTLASRAQDAELQRIRALQSLQADSAKVEGLRAALEGLSKKVNWQSALGESAQFGLDTKKHLDLLSCRDLNDTVNQLTAREAALTREIAAADAARAAELSKQLESVRASLQAATEGRAATGRFDGTSQACK